HRANPKQEFGGLPVSRRSIKSAKPRKSTHKSEARKDSRYGNKVKKAPLEALPEIGFVALPTVVQMFDSSPTTIYRWIEAGHFPKPIKISTGSTRWDVTELRQHMQKLRQGAV